AARTNSLIRMTPSRCLADFVAAAVKPTAIRPSAAGSQTRSSATHSRSPIQQLTSRRISGPHRPVVGS
ncbi:hypothetical protein NDU88_006311, partial [Pleurodeles waltl]